MNDRPVVVRRALISVWDKSGVVDFATRLVAADVEIISSGGTAKAIADAGIAVTKVADVTGAPEMLGGRVKTLHPLIHGAILADVDNPTHVSDLAERGVEAIQLVVCNLYPFEATVADPHVSEDEAIEKIDIGGPAMVRAAAKNSAHVAAVTSPDQYADVATAIESGGISADLRKRLAAAAFFVTARYDAAIVTWLQRSDPLPETMLLPLERHAELRYGENPHQAAAVYREAGTHPWWVTADYLQGKPMSFNNHADAEAAWALATAFEGPAAVVVKHTNPCGVAVGDSASVAFDAAWDCDPLSAFGGVVAINRAVDGATANLISRNFTEVVIAPSFDQEALEVLAHKTALRLIAAHPLRTRGLDLRRLEDGLLVQAPDLVDAGGWQVAGSVAPTAQQMDEMRFAWTVVAHTKSNAVVIASEGAAVGVGAGDQSRVGAAERAVVRAGKRANGGVAASDAFFPFRDGLDVLVDAGVAAVVQPGGSKRDDEVVAAADERGVAMVFTGRRHFRH